MTIEVCYLIDIIAGFQFLLLFFFLIFIRKEQNISNFIFSVFLAAKALSIANNFILSFNTFANFPYLVYLQFDYSFLYGPLIFFYTKSLIYRNYPFKKSSFIHFIPFILGSISRIALIDSILPYVNRAPITPENTPFFWAAIIIRSIVLILQLALYLFASLHILYKYRIELKNTFSSLKNINLSWLYFIIIGFALIWVNYVIGFIYFQTTDEAALPSDFISSILIFFFVNVIILKGLKKPEIFFRVDEKPKYESSPLTEKDIEHYLHRIHSYMEMKKPYLEPSLTINQLARKLSIPRKHLSQVINERLNQNFIDFVNRYRIEDAKLKLCDSSNNDITILNVLLEVGFNSKSVFNRAFRKYTGMTPSRYKRAHINQT